MSKTLEAITNEALELPRDQQIQLAHYILSLEEPPFDQEIEAAWEEEISARMQAVGDGKAKLIPWDEVRARVHERLRECK